MIAENKEVFMVQDTERNYRGTNFAVMALIVLLVLVGGYFLVAQLNDVSDDPANAEVSESYGGDMGTVGSE